MKELQEMRLFIYSLGLLVSSALERIITSIIDERLKLFNTNPFLYHFISIFLLVALFILTNATIKSFINKKWVSKMVFRNNYVGGHWIEIVYEESADKDKVSHFCDLEIGYDIDKIYLSGTDYDAGFKFMYNLETDSASMENYSLSYLFKCNNGKESWKGYGNIVFHKRVRSRPDRYTGRFTDDAGKKFRVEGFLIKDKEELEMLDAEFLPSFQKIIAGRINLSARTQYNSETEGAPVCQH